MLIILNQLLEKQPVHKKHCGPHLFPRTQKRSVHGKVPPCARRTRGTLVSERETSVGRGLNPDHGWKDGVPSSWTEGGAETDPGFFLWEKRYIVWFWEKWHQKSKSCEAISVGNGKAADLEKCNKMSTLKCHFKYPKRNRLLEKVGQIWAFNGDYLLWRIDSDGLTDRIWQSILNTSENQADSWNRRLSSGSWALWLGFTRRATPEARVPKPVRAGLLQTRGSV